MPVPAKQSGNHIHMARYQSTHKDFCLNDRGKIRPKCLIEKIFMLNLGEKYVKYVSEILKSLSFLHESYKQKYTYSYINKISKKAKFKFFHEMSSNFKIVQLKICIFQHHKVILTFIWMTILMIFIQNWW